ncbi:MAG: U32 family peptidase, partial [Clostridia bacterium]|nr:U32 family peptidase [Clostridia bacterium]
MMRSTLPTPELLAPAGSPEALDAAIEAGADAVYFGAGSFNARMRAKNFSDAELGDALAKCAAYGVKTYVTLNTRLRDAELPEALGIARELYRGGASALSVADAGLASLIKKTHPDFELHASTQTSCHSSLDASILRDAGFSRMVCPREISYEELCELCRRSPIEIEMFVHGAHCVSFSGQCLMSFALGGRSGNRGMCAQPCRLPFGIRGVRCDHPLSLKDMCLAGDMERLISSGVASLKIEGRQKSADYVFGTVRIYRRLLDERRSATEGEIEELSRIFSRDGFSDGYLKGSYRGMLGVREDEGAPQGLFKGLTRKIPVDGELSVETGKRSTLVLRSSCREAIACGAAASPREGGVPMSEEAARERVARLGATPFVLRGFSASIDPSASITLSELNSMRREAAEMLASPVKREIPDVPTERGKAFRRAERPARRLMTAQFASYGMIPPEAYDHFDKIYIPLWEAHHADGEKICVWAPPLCYDTDADELRRRLSLIGKGEVLVSTPAEARIASVCSMIPVASFRFNVTNSAAAHEVLKLARAVTISPEAPTALCRDIDGECGVIVYGRTPLMLTERCALSDGGAVCPFGGGGGRSAHRGKRPGAAQGKTCDGVLCRGTLCDR